MEECINAGRERVESRSCPKQVPCPEGKKAKKQQKKKKNPLNMSGWIPVSLRKKD